MIQRVLLSSLLICIFWSCQHQAPEEVKQEPIPERPYQIPKALKEIGEFAGVSFTDTTGLKQALTFKEIDPQGEIKTIHFEQAAQLYKDLLKSDQFKGVPIFEINGSGKVMLVVNGRGFGGLLWAKVLVDRKSKQVVKIEFGQKAESDDYAGELTENSFAERFTGKEIASDGNTFGLSQAGKTIIKGQSTVDGISGASMTSQGTIEMMNAGLKRYVPYLFGDD